MHPQAIPHAACGIGNPAGIPRPGGALPGVERPISWRSWARAYWMVRSDVPSIEASASTVVGHVPSCAMPRSRVSANAASSFGMFRRRQFSAAVNDASSSWVVAASSSTTSMLRPAAIAAMTRCQPSITSPARTLGGCRTPRRLMSSVNAVCSPALRSPHSRLYLDRVSCASSSGVMRASYHGMRATRPRSCSWE